jgi:hypothetical protein
MNGDEAFFGTQTMERDRARPAAGTRRAFLQAAALTAIAPGATLAAPAPVPVWWRSDDIRVDSPAFARLLDVALEHEAPVALATVPVGLRVACAERILDCERATVVQHGIAHANHAGSGAPIELGGLAELGDLATKLRANRKRLARIFGPRFLPALVPPWNRIDPALMARLPSLGFTALSTWGPREAPNALPGLSQINTHLSLQRWTQPRSFLSYAEATAALKRLVRRARAKGEPIGILTHHTIMDEAAFVALGRILDFIKRQPGMRLVGIDDLLRTAQPPGLRYHLHVP